MAHRAASMTVVLGCSFGGLECVHQLARLVGRGGRLTVIDPRSTHAYVPLLHEVVSGALPLRAITFDSAAHCRAIGASFVEATALAVDAGRRQVTTDRAGTIRFDRLVVATGSAPRHPDGGLGPTVIAARSLDDAAALLRRVRAVRAVRHGGARPTRAVVVGGGITGVEWAAELAHAGIDGERLRVTLIAGSARLVPELCAGVAAYAALRLDAIGVEVVLGQRASPRPGDAGPLVCTDDGRSWCCDVVVWAAGIAPSDSVRRLGLPRGETGALAVDAQLRVPEAPHIRVIGDAIEFAPAQRERPARRAIEAMHQARYVARAMARGDAGPYRPLGTFPYGLSLGGPVSAIVCGPAWFVATPNVWFRRALCSGYHARYRAWALPAIWRRGARVRVGRSRFTGAGQGPSYPEEVHP